MTTDHVYKDLNCPIEESILDRPKWTNETDGTVGQHISEMGTSRRLLTVPEQALRAQIQAVAMRLVEIPPFSSSYMLSHRV